MSDTPGLVIPLNLDDEAFKRRMLANIKLVDDGCGQMVSKAQATAARIDAGFGKVNLESFKTALSQTALLQDKLTAAVIAGEKDIATALNTELAVRRRVQAAAAAQLETQLAVAKATGSSKQAEELAEVLALQQRIAQLGAAGLGGSRALADAEAVGQALKGAETANVGKALQSVFDSSRLATLEEGSAKLRIFGSALEPLGGYGIAAAAGVVAVGEALAEAHEAIEYADGLYKAAAAAHTTTDELQELQVALAAAGGDKSGAGQALAAFNEELGRAEAGIPKALRSFQLLFGTAFNASDAKNIAANGDALDQVVAKIQNLKNPEQQDAAIQQFGLEGIKPLILADPDAWKNFREEAKAAGLVLDSEVIQRGHKLATQIDDLSLKIKNDLTSAFINLGPVLKDLVGLVAQMLDGVKAFTEEINRNPAFLKMLEGGAAGAFGNISQGPTGVVGGLASGLGGALGDQARKVAVDGGAFLNPDGSTSNSIRVPIQGGALPEDPGGGGLADLSAAKIDKESQDLALQAQAASLQRAAEELKAREALTEDVEKRADIEHQLAANAVAQRNVALDKQLVDAKAQAAQGLISQAALQQVQSEVAAAKISAATTEGLTTSLRDRQEIWALVDHEVDLRKQDVAALESQLTQAAAGATTLEQRNELERRLLAARQAEAKKESELSITRGLQTGQLNPAGAVRTRNDLQVQQNGEDQDLTRRQVSDFLAFIENQRQALVAAQTAELDRSEAHANALAGLATTAAERNKFEQQALASAQERDRILADAEVDRANGEKAAAIAAGDPTRVAQGQAHISAATAARDALPQTNSDQSAKLAIDQAGPVEQYARSIQDLNTAIQGDAVNAFKDLTSGLVDAALHAKNAGDVIRSVFLNLASQILTQTIQKDALPGFAALLKFIPGFADGTPGAPGGLSLVGERGPELINLPMGAKVYDNFKTMRALNSVSAPSAQPASVYAPASFDLRGAVVTSDLLQQMNSISAAHAAQAAQQGRRLAVQDVQRGSYLANLNGSR